MLNVEWKFHSYLDSGSNRKDQNAETTESTSNVNRARELFKNKTVRGLDTKAEEGLKTVHERAVTCILNATPGNNGQISTLSTSGLDGKLVVWNLPSLTADFASLTI